MGNLVCLRCSNAIEHSRPYRYDFLCKECYDVWIDDWPSDLIRDLWMECYNNCSNYELCDKVMKMWALGEL